MVVLKVSHLAYFFFKAAYNFLKLKGYSTPNENIVINHLPPCRSKPIEALFVFRTQFKIFWMKTGRLVTVPLTAK